MKIWELIEEIFHREMKKFIENTGYVESHVQDTPRSTPQNRSQIWECQVVGTM